VSKGMMTPALSCMQRAREKMREGGLGEPAVEIPMSSIATCVGEHGTIRAFVSMADLIEIVERIEMHFPEPKSGAPHD
jgi:hypothetical protein